MSKYNQKQKTEFSFFETWMIAMVLLLLFAIMADAATAAATSAVSSPVNSSENLVKNLAEKKSNLDWHLILGADASYLQTPEGNANYQGGYSVTGISEYKPLNINLASKLEWTHQYTYANEDGSDISISDLVLKLKKNVGVWRYGIGSSLALSKESLQATKKASLGPLVGYELKNETLIFNQELKFSHVFYEQEIAPSGKVNSPQAISLLNTLTIDLGKNFSIELVFLPAYLISYQGVQKTYITNSETIIYSINEKWSLKLGLVTKNMPTLAPDGQSNRVKMLDENQTAIDLGLEIAI